MSGGSRPQTQVQAIPDPVAQLQAIRQVAPPPSLATPFGRVLWGGTGYGFEKSDTEDQAKENLTHAFNANNQTLGLLANPSSYMQGERDRARSVMQPQFERQYENSLADITAGLGNRYFSTFGQLTGAQKARELARDRALMEEDIYQAGEQGLDRQIGRAGSLGDLLTNAMNIRQSPYMALAQLLGVAGANAQGTNSTAVGMYSPYAGAIASQNAALINNSRRQSGLGGLGGAQLAMQGANMLLPLIPGGQAASGFGAGRYLGGF